MACLFSHLCWKPRIRARMENLMQSLNLKKTKRQLWPCCTLIRGPLIVGHIWSRQNSNRYSHVSVSHVLAHLWWIDALIGKNHRQNNVRRIECFLSCHFLRVQQVRVVLWRSIRSTWTGFHVLHWVSELQPCWSSLRVELGQGQLSTAHRQVGDSVLSQVQL